MKVEEAGDNSMEEDLSHSTVKRDFEDVSEESLLMKEAATILIGALGNTLSIQRLDLSYNNAWVFFVIES